MKDIILAFVSGILGRPLVLQLEPTTLCNLKCGMCSHTTSGNIMHAELAPEQLENLKGKFLAINLSAIGEPLMNRQFNEILNAARKKCIYLTFTSNLIMLDKETAEHWVKVPVDSIYISIDGAEKEIYEKIRKGAVFEKLMENIKLLQNIKGNKKPKLIVRFCPTAANIYQMKEMPELLNSLGLKEIDITIFLASDSNTKNLAVPEDRFKREKEETLKNAKKFKIKVKFFKLNQKIRNCRARYTLIASASGEVVPCCFLLQKGDYNETIKKYRMGNIYKDGISKVWNSEQFRRLRYSLSKGKLPDACKGCEVYNQR